MQIFQHWQTFLLINKVKVKKSQIFDQNYAFTNPFFRNGNFLAFKYQRFVVFFGQFKRKKSRFQVFRFQIATFVV